MVDFAKVIDTLNGEHGMAIQKIADEVGVTKANLIHVRKGRVKQVSWEVGNELLQILRDFDPKSEHLPQPRRRRPRKAA